MDFTSTRCLTLLQAIIVCNFNGYQRTTLDNGQKSSFRPDFGPFWLKFRPPNFFLRFYATGYDKLLQAITVCNFKEN